MLYFSLSSVCLDDAKVGLRAGSQSLSVSAISQNKSGVFIFSHVCSGPDLCSLNVLGSGADWPKY